METIIREEDVIILADNKTYMVYKVFEYDGQPYMCLVCRTDFKEGEVPTMVLARERVDGDSVVVDIIKDRDFIEELSEELQKVL